MLKDFYFHVNLLILFQRISLNFIQLTSFLLNISQLYLTLLEYP